jgi:hypothetical protein
MKVGSERRPSDYAAELPEPGKSAIPLPRSSKSMGRCIMGGLGTWLAQGRPPEKSTKLWLLRSMTRARSYFCRQRCGESERQPDILRNP